MAKIELALEVGDDIEGILDPLAQSPVEDGPARIRKIILAIAVLEQNPLIGRPAEMDKRELIIGRRSRGDVA